MNLLWCILPSLQCNSESQNCSVSTCYSRVQSSQRHQLTVTWCRSCCLMSKLWFAARLCSTTGSSPAISENCLTIFCFCLQIIS